MGDIKYLDRNKEFAVEIVLIIGEFVTFDEVSDGSGGYLWGNMRGYRTKEGLEKSIIRRQKRLVEAGLVKESDLV